MNKRIRIPVKTKIPVRVDGDWSYDFAYNSFTNTWQCVPF